MKKVVLSLAGILAAAAFAPEASALPAFARQTGMACVACHQTHFPILNGFGRAFKAAGYTMMGAQEKVEGEHLSIPGVMNGAILMKYRYQKFSGATATPGAGVTAPTSEADGMIQMGDELSLFFGGRVAETEHFTIGFLAENNLAAGSVIDTKNSCTSSAVPAGGGTPTISCTGSGNVNMPLIAGLRVPVSVDLGAVKAQIVPFTTDSLGVAYGFELSSGGIMRANRWSELRRETSAVQYNADRGNDGGSAAGTAFVVQNDLGYINFTKWSSSFAPGAGGGWVPSTSFGQSYIRVAATPTVGDVAIVAGFGKESGSSYGNLAGAQVEANQTFADFQGHGAVAGYEAGLYAQYAKAPACTTAIAANCAHNSNPLDRSAFTVGGELQVIPHTLTLQAAYRNAKNGKIAAGTTATSETDNSVMFGVLYDLTQNVALVAQYAKYSGTTTSPQSTATGTTSQFLGMLEAAW